MVPSAHKTACTFMLPCGLPPVQKVTFWYDTVKDPANSSKYVKTTADEVALGWRSSCATEMPDGNEVEEAAMAVALPSHLYIDDGLLNLSMLMYPLAVT